MGFRLALHKATHHMWSGETWFVRIGPDIWNTDYGITLCWGGWTPSVYPSGWKVWKHEWRVNVRWPISFKSRSARRRS